MIYNPQYGTVPFPKFYGMAKKQRVFSVTNED